MKTALYHELVAWYSLLDPLEEHEAECHEQQAAFERVLGHGRHRLLELGSGAGHNMFFLKRAFDCTASDLSLEMLAHGERLNPECQHIAGDMRELRLGRTFDAVLVHDAICYMATKADLRAALATAFVHTRPGGVALFAPDTFLDTFAEYSDLHEGQEGQRALRCLEWSWDPDPADDSYVVDYAFLLREGETVRAVHDRHLEGLFSQATWVRLLNEAGYVVELCARTLDAGASEHGYAPVMLLCRRPS